MSYNESTTNLFYQQFKDTGLPAPFVALITARWAISMFGSLLNLSLVYVTIRSKSLHGSCNILIAVNALCTALFEPSLSIGLYIALSGLDFIPLRICFLLQVLPSLFGFMSLATMLAIGADRLVSICFSVLWSVSDGFLQWISPVVRSLQERQLPYLLVLLSICLAYSLFGIWQTFLISLELPDLSVICSSPGDCHQGPIGNFLYRLNVGVNLALLVEYILLWATFKLRQSHLASVEFTRRIIRSLTAITLLIIAGWVTNSVVRLFLPLAGLSPLTTVYTTFSFSFLPMLAMASNAPALFIFSQEYRRAFFKQFPRLLSPFKLNSSTISVAPQTHQLAGPSAAAVRAQLRNSWERPQ